MSDEYNNLKNQLQILQEQIMIAEIGNDFYHSSPLYKEHQIQLCRLNAVIKNLEQQHLSTDTTLSSCKSPASDI